MKKIRISNGMYIKIDKEDYDRISKIKWSACCGNNKRITKVCGNFNN
jgi:hypothetical protein